jgi:hypothetical protein
MSVWIETLTTEGQVPELWEASISSEYLRSEFWSRWMGDTDNACIQLNEDLTKAAGDAVNTTIRSQIIGGVIEGNQKTTGNEGTMEFYNFRQTVNDDKVAVKVENFPMTQQRNAFNMLSTMRNGLIETRRLRTDDRITAKLSDTSTGRVRGGYLYGSADSNWNATHATALQAIDAVDDMLKLDDIDILKRKLQALSGNRSAKVRPYRFNSGEMGGIEEWFVYIGHTFSIRDLTKSDPAWKNPMLLLPAMANTKSPIYSGNSFKGGFNGVLIYEYEGIGLDTSNIQYAHNLMLGAQAIVLAWAMHGKLTEEKSNYEKDIGLEHHEINSIEKVIWDRNTVNGATNEDNAIGHHFVAAVAD